MEPPVVYHPAYASDIGLHVFPTQKFGLIYEGLSRQITGLASRVHRPDPATEEQLRRVHSTAYLADLEACVHTMRTVPSELPISREIIDAYILMAGGTCLAGRLACEHGCSMNVGGGFHHAFADQAEGFCYINDVAVAVTDVLAKQPIERAAVIDTDLHQGNGTARIFLANSRVYTFSMHQENNYPIKEQSDLDIGLENGTDDAEYLERLDIALKSIFTGFKPQFVVYVGGVDPYRNDQLGALDLTKEGIKQRDRLVFEQCREHRVPVAAVLAGGYAYDVQDTVDMHMNTYLVMDSVFS